MQRNNNFGAIRIIAAFMVIAGHNAAITGAQSPFVFFQSAHAIGIKTLFAIGGYMIASSWLHDPQPVQYMIKRVCRIIPPLFVCIYFTVFIVGPVFTSLSLREYFLSRETYQYFWNVLLRVRYTLPGVFVNSPYSAVVNGSLWSLPAEFLNYLLVPLFLVLTRCKTKSKVSQIAYFVICVVVAGLQYYYSIYIHPNASWIFYDTDWTQAFHVLPYYFAGSCFALPFFKSKLNLQAAVAVLLLFLTTPLFHYEKREFIFSFVLPYLVLSFGEAAPAFFAKWTQNREISYGMFLYGFVGQQVVYQCTMLFHWPTSAWFQVGVSTVLVMGLAYLSYRFVEKPSARLTKKLVGLVGPK